jgi:steroid delta-isomerase-like uncharacterized protein
MSGPEQILIDRYFAELLNKGEFAGANDILTQDFVFHGPSIPGGLGIAGFKTYVEEMRAAFSNKRFTELERIVDGNRAAVRFRMTGTQDGPYQGLPPLGGSIDVEGCDLILVRSGKIAEVRAYFDLIAVIQKLLVPPPVRLFGELIGHLWAR